MPCTPPQVSPTRSPRTSTFKVPPLPCPRASGTTASPRTPSRTSPRVSPKASPRRCRSDSPQQQQQQPSAGAGPAATGYAAHHASRAAVQEQRTGSTSPQRQGARGPRHALQEAGTAAATNGADGSSSYGGSSKQMLTKQVQLLVSEYFSKHRLKQLQAKQEGVQTRKEQLLATKAQLELKQLQRYGKHRDMLCCSSIKSRLWMCDAVCCMFQLHYTTLTSFLCICLQGYP